MNVTMKSMLGMNTSKTRSPWLRFSLKAWGGSALAWREQGQLWAAEPLTFRQRASVLQGAPMHLTAAQRYNWLKHPPFRRGKRKQSAEGGGSKVG